MSMYAKYLLIYFTVTTIDLEIKKFRFNPLNAVLNPICHLLAFLAHPILHVSRIRVKQFVYPEILF